jgi:hypothetical protein
VRVQRPRRIQRRTDPREQPPFRLRPRQREPPGLQRPDALPAPDGPIAGVHDAEVTPDTIIPPWSGERLDLDYAICTGLANEKILTDRAAGRPVDALATSGFQPKRCGDPYCGFCFSLPLPATGAQIQVPV